MKYRQLAEEGTWSCARECSFAAMGFQQGDRLRGEKARVQFSSHHEKPSHFVLFSLIFRGPVFLQLAICSNRAKTALHSVALNESRQVIAWQRTLI